MVNRSWLFRILASGKHAVNLLALRKEDTAKLILHTRRGEHSLEMRGSEGMPVLSLNG